jgi:hypothetical protein
MRIEQEKRYYNCCKYHTSSGDSFASFSTLKSVQFLPEFQSGRRPHPLALFALSLPPSSLSVSLSLSLSHTHSLFLSPTRFISSHTGRAKSFFISRRRRRLSNAFLSGGPRTFLITESSASLRQLPTAYGRVIEFSSTRLRRLGRHRDFHAICRASEAFTRKMWTIDSFIICPSKLVCNAFVFCSVSVSLSLSLSLSQCLCICLAY